MANNDEQGAARNCFRSGRDCLRRLALRLLGTNTRRDRRQGADAGAVGSRGHAKRSKRRVQSIAIRGFASSMMGRTRSNGRSRQSDRASSLMRSMVTCSPPTTLLRKSRPRRSQRKTDTASLQSSSGATRVLIWPSYASKTPIPSKQFRWAIAISSKSGISCSRSAILSALGKR